MSWLSRILRPQANENKGPADDFWYNPIGLLTASGQRVTAETALKLSAVWRCVDIIAGSVAWLPLDVYQRLPLGAGKLVAETHPMQTTLHLQANPWQTAYEFREMLTMHLLLRGNGYAQIVPVLDGRRPDGTFRPVDLIPLHPDRMRVEQDDAGRIHYVYRKDGRPEQEVPDIEIFHVRGLTFDGVTGLDPITAARESLGLALSQERFGGQYFAQAPQISGVLKHPGRLSQLAHDRVKESWTEAHAGRNAHTVAVLEEGLDFKEFNVGLTAEQAQMVESREFQITDIARWFGVPPHMIGETTKETSWGSGIEQMSIGFVQYTLVHWLKRWEQAISRDLLTAPQRFFAEFTVDGLLRGDQKTRYEAHASALQNKWMTRNEVRALENLNPIPGGDSFENPAITPGQGGSENDGDNERSDPDDSDAGDSTDALASRNGHRHEPIPSA